jgi:hypothetical protein
MRAASFAILLIAIFAGCAKSSVETLVKPECPGQRFAVITNRWQTDLDVLAPNGNRAASSLGSVAPGSQERFLLPDGMRSVFVRTQDTPPSTVPATAVDIRYVCE